MTPLYFGDCFAWLHPAQGARGVVLCSAFGVEELCTHRFMRHFADQLAAANLPTLRFDYHGTGNSAGDDTDVERVETWLNNIVQAVNYLKQELHVSEVALVGLRLGGLLATEAARRLTNVTYLALLAPVVSGKNYIRESKVLARLIAQSGAARDLVADTDHNDGFEIAGFQLTNGALDALKQLDILQASAPPAKKVLLYGHQYGVADNKLATHLTALGCGVDQAPFPGFAALVWDSSFAELPADAFTAAVQWLASDLPVAATAPVAATTAVNAPLTELHGNGWCEQPIQFGPAQRLFGICCRPVTPAATLARKPALLFINHGSNHHIGWARMHVKLSRRFAALGIACLRIDVSGIGDSPAHPGYAENYLYARHTQADVYAALDWLQQQGYQQLTLVGHCAGAHLGFYSTVRDRRVNNLVMLNLQRFFWARGTSLKAVSQETYRSSAWYRAGIRDPEVWKRLLTAQINVSGISKIFMRRLMQNLKRLAIDTFGPLFGREGMSRKVIRWLSELSTRGTRVLLIYSAEDAGLDEIAIYAGPYGKKLKGLRNIQVNIIEGADHNMTSANLQAHYAHILERFLS